MSFDEEPEDPHWECGLQIHLLEQEKADLAARLQAAETRVEDLEGELDVANRLRAFDTGTIPLPKGLMLEHFRLDGMWQRLVREKREAEALADRLGEALGAYRLAQGRMRDQWAESDDLVRRALWAGLHVCEDAAMAALAEWRAARKGKA